MVVNEWTIWFFKTFGAQYRTLVQDVLQLKDSNPQRYKSHPKTKMLAAVQKSLREVPTQGPFHHMYSLGNSLGHQYSAWRRVKNGLPQRHRLFFQAATTPGKRIVFAWLNLHQALRKERDKHDVYRIFAQMIASGEIPTEINTLLAHSHHPPDAAPPPMP